MPKAGSRLNSGNISNISSKPIADKVNWLFKDSDPDSDWLEGKNGNTTIVARAELGGYGENIYTVSQFVGSFSNPFESEPFGGTSDMSKSSMRKFIKDLDKSGLKWKAKSIRTGSVKTL